MILEVEPKLVWLQSLDDYTILSHPWALCSDRCVGRMWVLDRARVRRHAICSEDGARRSKELGHPWTTWNGPEEWGALMLILERTFEWLQSVLLLFRAPSLCSWPKCHNATQVECVFSWLFCHFYYSDISFFCFPMDCGFVVLLVLKISLC